MPIRLLGLIFFLLICRQTTRAQDNPSSIPFTGYVRDAASGEPIQGVNVFVIDNRKGVMTGKDGFFVIPLAAGTYSVRFTHLGYRPITVSIPIKERVVQDIRLESDARDLEELLVSTEAADRNVRKVELGVTRLNIKSIRQIPAFMGEVDVVRSLLLLPGVTSVGEGAPGFNVRGGNTDQNLILVDDAPVFNPSHLMGFFSAFNPDAVRDVMLHRGGIAPGYGGRASSVLDVRLKEPETERWTLNGGIGLISSRLTVEGPVVKNKLSALAAFRGSFNDFLFKLGPKNLRDTKANFYDGTLKAKFQPNERQTFTYTGYLSHDVFKLASDSLASVEVNASSTQYTYKTLNHTLKWNYSISEKLNLSTAAIWSQYRPESSSPDSSNAFRLTSRVEHRQLRTDLTFVQNEKHSLQGGLSIIDYRLEPNSLVPGPYSSVLPKLLPTERAYELAAYVQDEWKLAEAVSVLGGLRFSELINRGPGDVRTFAENQPFSPNSIVSVRTYGAGEVSHRTGGLEPRLALRFTLSEGQSIKAGYNRMRQYIHQITNTTAALPISRWKLSDRYLKPQIADQWSLGYFRNTADNAYELTAEVYYKILQNAIDFKDGADVLLSEVVEAEVLQGRGTAYGLETQLRRNKGRLTGWVSYTYSRTLLTLNGRFPEERINGGRAYPANFDKPHAMNASLNYRPNVRVAVSFNYTYSTGRPMTQPYGKAVVGGVPLPIFLDRNQQRIPDYHRLDFSAQFDRDLSIKKTKRWQGSWIFSVYNVYGHRNAYSVFFRLDPRSFKDAYKLSVFGAAFPSLTYNFKY
ncbi:TonB-dependent receptor [Tellurirhabdus rosea]|uniref:TonB-dependent receptor n=1 Tax=Tellurirhabdus rosea TaxID=2674997 RepID=UPI002250CDA8|nr:TonB-dependent receptor [Tellurirhabdus rosea]